MVEVLSLLVGDNVMKRTQTSWACIQEFPLHYCLYSLMAACPMFLAAGQEIPLLRSRLWLLGTFRGHTLAWRALPGT